MTKQKIRIIYRCVRQHIICLINIYYWNQMIWGQTICHEHCFRDQKSPLKFKQGNFQKYKKMNAKSFFKDTNYSSKLSIKKILSQSALKYTREEKTDKTQRNKFDDDSRTKFQVNFMTINQNFYSNKTGFPLNTQRKDPHPINLRSFQEPQFKSKNNSYYKLNPQQIQKRSFKNNQYTKAQKPLLRSPTSICFTYNSEINKPAKRSIMIPSPSAGFIEKITDFNDFIIAPKSTVSINSNNSDSISYLDES